MRIGNVFARGVAKVAILTPPNRGAIAVLGIWGPHALVVADSVFRPLRGPRLADSRPGFPRLGRVGEGLGDEVVAVVLKGTPNHEATNEREFVEFQCHGGFAACELVLNALEASGATRVQPSESYQSSVLGPTRIAAWQQLPLASTVRVAEILLDQATGALEREILSLMVSLRRQPPDVLPRSLELIEDLIARARVGVRLIQGWRVVLAGRPNVGKSSLLNALAGFTRSIVDAAPGTTRDVVSVSVSIDGWPVELSDTAGLRDCAEGLERTGIERAQLAYDQSDLVIPVLDQSEPLREQDFELLRRCAATSSPIVINKSDCPAVWSPVELCKHTSRLVNVSARDGNGIPLLVSAIPRALVPLPPSSGVGIPIRGRDVELLLGARQALLSGDRIAAVERISGLIGPIHANEGR